MDYLAGAVIPAIFSTWSLGEEFCGRAPLQEALIVRIFLINLFEDRILSRYYLCLRIKGTAREGSLGSFYFFKGARYQFEIEEDSVIKRRDKDINEIRNN